MTSYNQLFFRSLHHADGRDWMRLHTISWMLIRQFSNNTARVFIAPALTDLQSGISLRIEEITLHSRQSRC